MIQASRLAFDPLIPWLILWSLAAGSAALWATYLALRGRAWLMRALALTVLTKCLAHWAGSVLPLVVAAPLLGLFMNMDPVAIGATALTLLVGTPAITFIGAAGAAVAVALPRGGLLISVLVLPLTIPVLIFGVSAANAAISGPVTFATPFTILCGLALLSIVAGTFAAAAALRHAMD